MDALSSEWRAGTRYEKGDRVALKLGNMIGAEAFECIRGHISNTHNQPVAVENDYWMHYPKGFPRISRSPSAGA